MRKNLLLASATFACLVGSAAMVGSSCNGNTPNKRAGELVLNASDPITWSGGSSIWTDTASVLPNTCRTGGFWDSTYSIVGNFQIDGFDLPHYSGFDLYSYWGGFTTGSNGDSYCFNDSCYKTGGSCNNANIPPALLSKPCNCDSLAGSGGWIHNQWGVMAGGGIKNYSEEKVPEVDKDTPYLIAFGSPLSISLTSGASFEPQGVFICNHPWPYYGNIYGDGFARPLDRKGDYFVLQITGLDKGGAPIGSIVTDTLAKYNALDTAHPIQPKNWHWVDLSEIDAAVQTLRFQLSTTDTGMWGPNTAFYFCMDKLTVQPESSVAQKSVAQKSTKVVEETPVEEFGDFLTVGTHVAGDAVLHNAQGQVALKTTLKVGSNKLDTRKLPAGKYAMVHHHRVKHFVKNK